MDNIIIEKANHPREHVGESLVANTTRVLAELGVLEMIEKEGFTRKYGAARHPPSSAGTVSIRFAEFPLEGVNQPYTYHVDRGKFDLVLLKKAEELGSKVCQGVAVTQILFDDRNFACGVRAKIGGQTVDLPCTIVVDAGGRDTILGRHLKLKKQDPVFNQYAIHTWCENVDRGSDGTHDFIHIYFLPLERAWVWQSPVSETVTSIGLVAERGHFAQSKMDPEGFFAAHIRSTPDLVRAMHEGCPPDPGVQDRSGLQLQPEQVLL